MKIARKACASRAGRLHGANIQYSTGHKLMPAPEAQAAGTAAVQTTAAVAVLDMAETGVLATTGRMERSHPAESQERGIANSDQPQSRQTFTSGDGVIGGWLRVRRQLR